MQQTDVTNETMDGDNGCLFLGHWYLNWNNRWILQQVQGPNPKYLCM